MTEVSWDSDYEQTYNPFIKLREKKVVINPRLYGKTKSEKKAFRLEERRRWDNILNEDRRKNDERRELQERHHQERLALQRRHEEETAELDRQHETWDGEYCTSPPYCNRKMQEAQKRPKGDNILDDCSWDNDNFNDCVNNRSMDSSKFMHADLNCIRLYLNSEVYPHERWNLEFDKKLDGAAYYAYEQFQRSYYDKDMSEPMMDLEEFRKNPLFVIDCVHQKLPIKSSTVDIKLEFETRKKNFPKNTRVYALILHDTYITYNALDGTVSKGAYVG